jgi:hypothetical protein
MPNIIPNNNLQVSSQPWARELQKRLEELERNFNLQKVNSNTVDSQLQSSYRRLDTAVKNIDTVYVDVDALTEISNNAVTAANEVTALVQSGPAPTPTSTNSATGFGYIGVPQISTATSITGTDTNWPSYAGDHIYTTVTGQTHTLPANATIPLQIGTRIMFINADGVSTTIAIGGTDVLILSGTATVGSRTLASNGVATAIKITATSWTIFGNGLT